MLHILQSCLLALLVFAIPGRGLAAASAEPEPASRKSTDGKSTDFLFEAHPKVIAAGETVVLHWEIKGATKVVIDEQQKSSDALHNLGTFGGSGTLPVHPTENTMYIVTCEGSTSHSCASVSVRVRVKRR